MDETLITPEAASELIQQWLKRPLSSSYLIKMSHAGKFVRLARRRYGAKRFRRSEVLEWCKDQLGPEARRLIALGEAADAG